jgi:hypothetical protein
MGRRIVGYAALLALVVSLTACACPASGKGGEGGASGSSGAAGTSGTAGGSGATGSSGSGGSSASVCVPSKCVHNNDCTACYRSEVDRNMGNLKDDLPPGGCCCDCPAPPVKKHEHKECCPEK